MNYLRFILLNKQERFVAKKEVFMEQTGTVYGKKRTIYRNN
jgi:hypothetical protein